jgi:hypothetical protein
MTFMLLRRNAAEVSSLTRCGLCLTGGRPRDHLLPGQPGATGAGIGLCQACGDVLLNLTRAFGSTLSVHVELSGSAQLARLGRRGR